MAFWMCDRRHPSLPPASRTRAQHGWFEFNATFISSFEVQNGQWRHMAERGSVQIVMGLTAQCLVSVTSESNGGSQE